MTERPGRALRQYLESLARAGLSHLPRPTLGDAESAALLDRSKPATAPKSRDRAAAPSPADLATSTGEGEPSQRLSAPAEPTAAPLDRRPPPPEGSAVPSPEPAKVAASITPESTSDERRTALDVVAKCVAACTRCPELAETRTQTVFGVGDPGARLLFLGEAPGADEDRTGEPFVGRAGQLLTKIIEACGLRREEVYICNVLKCRPPGNRNPTDDEAENCREYLDAQLAIVRPEYIVCWGSVAARNLLDTKTTIGRLRGEFHVHEFAGTRAKVLCTYHPSYLLRNPAAKKDVWEDMKFLFRDMGVELGPGG